MNKRLHWLDTVKEYGRDYVLENTGLKFLALLITGVLWLSVASRPVSEITMYNIPIEFKNIPESPEQLTVSKYDATSLTARVFLRGPRDVLDTLRLSDLTAFADLQQVEPGVRVVTLQVDQSRLPASLLARVVEPRSIRVTVERMVEREVPVRPRFDGDPPPGYEVLSRNIEPSAVRIVGAESQVRDINEVSTETVRLADRTSVFSDWVAVDLGNPNVNFKNEKSRKVMLTLNIGEVRKERIIDRIPIRVEGAVRPDAGVARVTIFGASSAVDAITPEDIIVSADYSVAGRAREVAPVVTISQTYADRVSVRSVLPRSVRVR
jgi:YbbR domain-containing protein